jgi:hypothetical protein
MKKRLFIALPSALLVALLVGLAAFGPLVRAVVRAQAERRGLVVTVGSVRPGLGRVGLGDLRVALAEVPGLAVELSSVEVRLSPSLGVAGLAAHGGSMRVTGSAEEVTARLKSWRAKRTGKGSGSPTPYTVDGIDLVWQNASPSAKPLYVWGLRYQRGPDGAEIVGADLVRAGLGGASVDLSRPELTLARQDGSRRIDRLVAEGAEARLELEPPAPPDPKLAKAGDPAAPDPKRTSATEPAARGPLIRQALGRIATLLAESLPEKATLDLGGLRLELRRGPDSLSIGPGRLTLERERDRAKIGLVSGSEEHRTPLTLHLDLPLKEGPVKADLGGGPVSLATLGIKDGNFGLREVGSSELEARTALELSADGRTLGFVASGQARGLSLEHKRLAGQALRGVNFGWSTAGDLALDGTRVHLERAEFSVGHVRLTARGDLERTPQYTKVRVDVAIPLAACQDLLDAVPTGLLPLLAGMTSSGSFALDSQIEFDTRRPKDTLVRWKMQEDCHITSVPDPISPRRFAGPWEREVPGGDGRKLTIESGPGSPTWVPRSAISNHAETAVLICEDGAFFRHRGIDPEAIANSLKENLRTGEFVRGASTISMQLAKNVYLGREKTLSRKLQEAVLTRLLEQELGKDQIMELYLNVIEFGPGIYGIGPAAAFYFNTTPSELSLGQALYLGSILSNPKWQHFGADGEVGPRWADYLRKLMRIAFKIHRINQQELDQALGERVIFHSPAPGHGGNPAPATPGSSPGSEAEPPEPPRDDAAGH